MTGWHIERISARVLLAAALLVLIAVVIGTW
jgi:hypothetical protein